MDLWVDKEFPPSNSSVYFHQNLTSNERLQWKRPNELCNCPKLRESCISNPSQGPLGDCWLICTFYTLSKSNAAFEKVFKSSLNNLYGSEYDGKITLQLWINGSWTDITIDDYLPTLVTRNGTVKLAYGHCEDETQFWVALLEKACAKLYGCYEALHSGQVMEGHMLVTGGYSWKEKIIDTPEKTRNENVVKKLIFLCDRTKNSSDFIFISSKVIISSYEDVQTPVDDEYHCYCVLSVDNKSNDPVLQLWNPWKTSSKSSKIQRISFNKLLKFSPEITFTTMNLHSVFSLTVTQNLKTYEKSLTGEWKAGRSSGGHLSSRTFHQNPQFLLSFTSDRCKNNFAHLSLMQTSKRKYGNRKRLQQAIGLHVWKLDCEPQHALSFEQMNSLGKYYFSSKPEYDYAHVVSLTFPIFMTSQSGSESIEKYLVILSTYAADICGSFYVRITSSLPVAYKLLTKMPN